MKIRVPGGGHRKVEGREGPKKLASSFTAVMRYWGPEEEEGVSPCIDFFVRGRGRNLFHRGVWRWRRRRRKMGRIQCPPRSWFPCKQERPAEGIIQRSLPCEREDRAMKRKVRSIM